MTKKGYTKQERRERLVQVYLDPATKSRVQKLAKQAKASVSSFTGQLIAIALSTNVVK